MAEIDFISPLHKSTKRDYLGRVTSHDKSECAEIARQWGRDYWDGERHLGYGGYRYDGRWSSVAAAIATHYQLPENSRILDVGCGKAFLLYEFTRVLPNAEVVGIDISEYAIENAKEEVRSRLLVGDAARLPFPDQHFDLVYSLNTLHNLPIDQLWRALREMQRVGRGAKYLVVESFRNEREKVNLLYWQLTCRAFHSPDEWKWLFQQTGYTGDYSFIYFE